MSRIETSAFSVVIDERFADIRVLGTMIGARSVPETMVSPSMSIWTAEKEEEGSLAERLSAMIEGGGRIVERRPFEAAGMQGEYVLLEDRLIDEEDGLDVGWCRFRVLLDERDGDGYYCATAMCAAAELEAVGEAFLRMLASIEVRLTGEAASEARQRSDAMLDQTLDAAMEQMERAAAMMDAVNGECSGADESNNGPAASVFDAKQQWQSVLESEGLAEHGDSLLGLVRPMLVLTEAGEDRTLAAGLTRIGGGPDLPTEVEWPRNESGLYYNFLAQINLADLPLRAAPLPETGWLTFWSDTDLAGGLVRYFPPDAEQKPVRHQLAEDAEQIACAAAAMLVWSSEQQRLVANGPARGELSVRTEADGRLRFERAGVPVLALASEYEICDTPQLLRIDCAYSVPDDSPVYAPCGIDDPYSFTAGVREAMQIGDGPQHRMFGYDGCLLSAAERAAEHARAQGWAELAEAGDWFVLLALQSGGAAGFEFWDHGRFLYMANVKDTARGDFSRVYCMVESS